MDGGASSARWSRCLKGVTASASKKHRFRRKWHLRKEEAPFVSGRYKWRAVQRLLQCQVKIPYPDRQAARLACAEMLARTGDRLRPYKCRVKGHYHIGHSRRDRRLADDAGT